MALVGVAVATPQIVTPSTGSIQSILPRGGILLGIFCNAAGTVALYNSATVAGAATIVATLTLVAGWNAVPYEFTNGLCANSSTSQSFFVG